MELAIDNFQQSLQNWGYLILFFASFGGGYVGIVAAGIFSAMGGMNIFLSILTAFCGNVIGSTFLAILMRWQKKDLKFISKHRRKVALTSIWLKRYGIWFIFISKYIYLVKTIVPIVIGISKYDLKKYSLYNMIACAIWALVVGFVSYFAGYFIKRILLKFSNIPSYIFILIGLIVVIMIGLMIWYYSQKKAVKNKSTNQNGSE